MVATMIREMRPGDVPAAHAIRLRVRENRLSDPSVVTELDYHEFLARDTMSWVCEVDGTLVGFVMVNMEKQNLWALFVAPEQEAKGIGRILHQTMISAYWRRRDVLRLTSDPNSRAARFYIAAGYLITGRTQDGGELIFEMHRP